MRTLHYVCLPCQQKVGVWVEGQLEFSSVANYVEVGGKNESKDSVSQRINRFSSQQIWYVRQEKYRVKPSGLFKVAKLARMALIKLTSTPNLYSSKSEGTVPSSSYPD